MTQQDNLVRMANQIGTYFESLPDRAEALEGIANHLRKFWEPRMRRAFLALLDQPGAAGSHGISDIVQSAVRQYRAELEPASPR